MNKYVVYYRVSTQKQGRSGLGLEAQRAYILHFLSPESIVAEFTEVRSGGKIENRPQLKDAMKLCNQFKYILAVATVDRLSRTTEDALMIFSRLEGRLFSCDIPQLDKFTLTLFMAIADRERELIRIRTKRALDAKRRRDGEWRKSKLKPEDRKKGSEALKTKALENSNNKKVRELIYFYRQQNMSFQIIADKLNEAGFLTARNKTFQKTTVKRLYDRYCEELNTMQ